MGVGSRVGSGDGWGRGEWWKGNGDNCTWTTIKNVEKTQNFKIIFPLLSLLKLLCCFTSCIKEKIFSKRKYEQRFFLKSNFFLNNSFIYLFIHFLERGEGREKETEISMCGCLSCGPHWGPGLQPRHVPRLGIELTTLWFAARAQFTERHQPGLNRDFILFRYQVLRFSYLLHGPLSHLWDFHMMAIPRCHFFYCGEVYLTWN